MPEKRPNGLTMNTEFKKACEWSPTLTAQAVNTVNTVIIDVVKRRDEGGQEEGCQHEAGRQPSASNHGGWGRGLWAG